MDWIIIPARKGSKGLPGKNRSLFKYTAEIIPEFMKQRTIVSTDDLELMTIADSYGFNLLYRSSENSTDTADMNSVLSEVLVTNPEKIQEKDIIVMLYLTYPERTWNDVVNAYLHFKNKYARSLLCCEQMRLDETHPYLYMYDNGNGTGRQIVHHNLYRRQDYPNVFKISHFVFLSYADEIKELNKNLYNERTVFYSVNSHIDVDTVSDLNRFKGSRQ